MTNLAKITEDINVDKFNQMSDQLENQAERLAKLMEINKELIKNTLEFNAVNNANYKPLANDTDLSTKDTKNSVSSEANEDSSKKQKVDSSDTNVSSETNKTTDSKVSLIQKDTENKEDAEDVTETEEKYSPTDTQKKQVNTIISKIKKSDTIKNITPEVSEKDNENDSVINKDEIQTEVKDNKEGVNETETQEKAETETDWSIKIDLKTLSSTKVNENDTPEEIEAKKLLNEVKKEDEDNNGTNKIDLSKIM